MFSQTIEGACSSVGTGDVSHLDSRKHFPRQTQRRSIKSSPVKHGPCFARAFTS